MITDPTGKTYVEIVMIIVGVIVVVVTFVISLRIKH
jgi:hypothetical protein